MNLQHRLGCTRPDVQVTRGVTKQLIRCVCGAEAWEPLR